jgi:hypothetical protein
MFVINDFPSFVSCKAAHDGHQLKQWNIKQARTLHENNTSLAWLW